MNKNWIRVMRRRASWQLTTKPISINDTGCKSGGCGPKAVILIYVGTLKGVGRIHQQTFIDTYTKIALAKLYDRKNL
jgi:hypothetical protein